MYNADSDVYFGLLLITSITFNPLFDIAKN